MIDFAVLPPTAEQVKAALIHAASKTDPRKALGVFKDILSGREPSEPVIDTG